MKFSEAIAILEIPEGSHEVDGGLTSAYRRAMKKYHPDVTTLPKDFALKMAKLVNEAYAFLHENMGKWSAKDIGDSNLAEVMVETYRKIYHLPNITIDRFGVWLWITIDGPEEFHPEQDDSLETLVTKRRKLKEFRKGVGAKLSAAGFRYAPKKQKWSWHAPEDRPAFWKRQAWDWDVIKSRFDHEELTTRASRALG